MKITDEETVHHFFHIQHRSDSRGHEKHQNTLGLGKAKYFPILIDSHFYEPISILKSQTISFHLMNEPYV